MPDGVQTTQAYVTGLYRLAIGVAALFAVVRLIMAGAKYILTDVVTQKGDAKKDIQNALVGLLIVLSAVLILTTINPQLINLDALNKLQAQNFVIDGPTPATPTGGYATRAEAESAAAACGGTVQANRGGRFGVTCPTGGGSTITLYNTQAEAQTAAAACGGSSQGLRGGKYQVTCPAEIQNS